MNKLLIDSTLSKTELCGLGEKYPTDKSPYNSLHRPEAYRHPYTAVYDLMFSHIRHKKLNVGEIGILDNNSIFCWREYFPNANLYAWDCVDHIIMKAIKDGIPGTTYGFMDVKSPHSVNEGFKINPNKFDIIIDDSTHVPEDQVTIIAQSIPFLVEGGVLIIEDVFRSVNEEYFASSLLKYNKYFKSVTFIDTEHKNKNSTGWDNDKLLILVRNNVQYA